jgi:hypothetical protein
MAGQAELTERLSGLWFWVNNGRRAPPPAPLVITRGSEGTCGTPSSPLLLTDKSVITAEASIQGLQAIQDSRLRLGPGCPGPLEPLSIHPKVEIAMELKPAPMHLITPPSDGALEDGRKKAVFL